MSLLNLFCCSQNSMLKKIPLKNIIKYTWTHIDATSPLIMS